MFSHRTLSAEGREGRTAEGTNVQKKKKTLYQRRGERNEFYSSLK